MKSIELLPLRLDVTAAHAALLNSTHWSEHPARLGPDSPHRETSDIWVRFAQDFNEVPKQKAFLSEWKYPELTAVLAPLTEQVFELVRCQPHLEQAEETASGTASVLGGVLVTKIPAGKRIYPHIDRGWHPTFYNKYCVCISHDRDQAFCFTNDELRTESGQVFQFQNNVLHWITNQSAADRISLIVCIRERAPK